MLHPSEVGVALGRHAVLPALVVLQAISAPVRDVERWICQDVVSPHVGVTVVTEGIAVGDLPLDAPDG